MKSIGFKLWILMAMLCLSFSASAYDFEVDGIYYNVLSLEDLTCEVTYNSANANSEERRFYNKRGSSSERSSLTLTYPSYTGDVTIPATVNYKGRDLSVIGLGEYAFLNCTGLTSLSLPSTITQIKDVLVNERNRCYAGAFDYCNIETFSAGNAYTLDMFVQSYAYDAGYKTQANLKNLILSEGFFGVINVDLSDYKDMV